MIRNLELPNGDVYDLPGKAYASTDEWNTPNVEKFEGTTQGKLEATAETYGKIYVVPTPVGGLGGGDITPAERDALKTRIDALVKKPVEWKQITSTGTKIAEITLDGNKTNVYAPNGGGGGGSTVTVTPKCQSGIDVATITVDGDDNELYADITDADYTILKNKLDNLPPKSAADYIVEQGTSGG